MLGLGGYFVRRLLQLVPILLGILLVNFVLIHMAPGDPIQMLAGDFAPSPEYAAKIRAEFGLDRPLWQQAAIYFAHLLRGDLGYSMAYRQPVAQLIRDRAMATLVLSGSALLLAIVVGVALGVAACRRPASGVDAMASLVGLIGYSVPVFWLGQILLILFALHLGWFPSQGMYSLRTVPSGWGYILDVAHHLVLPAITLAALQLAIITRLTRASMREALSEDFVRTARAKGVSERTVVFHHALRNAALPVVTIVGMSVGIMLAGAVLTETVYGWPGLGRLMYEALLKRDYPVMMGMLAVVSVGVVVANLLTDLVYALLDPRIRYA